MIYSFPLVRPSALFSPIKHLLMVVIAMASVGSVLAQTASLSEIRELATQSRYEEAYQQLGSYLEARPADEQARLLEGVLLTRLDRIDDAINVFTRLAEDNPNLAEPHNNLAVLFAAQGRFDEARRSLLSAIALQPDYDIARENLGDVYARLADIEYRRAHRINRDNLRAKEKAETIATLFESIEARAATAPPAVETTDAEKPATQRQPRAAPATGMTTSSATSRKCIVISGLADTAGADIVAAWLEDRGATVTDRGSREAEQITSYQIYIPPLGDRGAAKTLAAKMKQSGITDLYVISSGSLTNGISLGIYVTASASGRRMAELREMGYDVRRRPRFESVISGFVEADVTDANIDEADVGRKFPDYILESSPCR